MIEAMAKDYPVRELCTVLGVTRSGYYGWRNGQESARELANRLLVEEIHRVHRQNRGDAAIAPGRSALQS